ncbi:uncharacterized protein LOC128556559 [Mercenaria mercenaria]|uniref:uncharacterized protein LOC128556559 n=1 Tax=Mercenaria mercenaria TaxID=6596 RepID=UPI00234E7A6A|nr:uncharacterized protein LOC128556559 [Mercenaria mercenaria]
MTTGRLVLGYIIDMVIVNLASDMKDLCLVTNCKKFRMTLLDKRCSYLLYMFVYTVFPIVLSSFVNYTPGLEYLYNLNSDIELKGVQAFLAKGQIGFVNIAEGENNQELLLIVYGLTFTPEGHPEAVNHHHDFSKWFSFEINNRGEIGKVYHPADEDREILMLKKGFAGMLSAKLHHRHEVEHEIYQHDSWGYKTDEFGREGQHNASYVVRKTSKGCEYIKTRNSTKIQSVNGNGTFIKLLNFHEDLNTIYSVMIEEELCIGFSTKEG